MRARSAATSRCISASSATISAWEIMISEAEMFEMRASPSASAARCWLLATPSAASRARESVTAESASYLIRGRGWG